MKRLHEQQAEQVARAAGVTPLPPGDDEYLHVSFAAIEAHSILGVRREDEGQPFTGWEIISIAEDVETAKFGYFSTIELEAVRPEWMMALALPAGWSFRFEGTTLVHCMNPAGVTIPMQLAAFGNSP
jgi:hypothetical protein